MTLSKSPAVPDTGGRAAVDLPALTGLRFIAALAVFLYHSSMNYSPIPPFKPVNPFADQETGMAYADALRNMGYIGVSFFFVLSGFVLTWSSRPGERARSFVRRRLLKIFPNHLITWVVAMVLFAAAVTPMKYWLPNLFLLHSFSSDPYAWVSVSPVNWSLSSELLFYLLFPLLILPVRRIREDRLWAWATAMVVAVGLVALVNDTLVPVLLPDNANAALNPPATGPQFWLGYFFPPLRMFEFVLGMLLARIVAAGRWPRIGVLPAGVLIVGGYVASLHVPYVYGFNAATIIPVAVLIGSVATADVRAGSSWLGSGPMRWLGNISFGFYLSQAIILVYGRSVVGDNAQYSTPVAIAVVAGFLAANIVAGWLLYTLVERPVMRRWGRSRRRIDPATVPAVPPQRTPVEAVPRAAMQESDSA